MRVEETPTFRLTDISERDRELLEDLRAEFRKTYNHYLRVIRETGITSKTELEKKTAVTSRRRNVSYPVNCEILANTRQCARDKAVECVRLYNDLRTRKIRTEFPEFMFDSIDPRLNWRDGYKVNPNGTVRISVRKGESVMARLEGGEEELERLVKALAESRNFKVAEVRKDGNDYFIQIGIKAQRCP